MLETEDHQHTRGNGQEIPETIIRRRRLRCFGHI